MLSESTQTMWAYGMENEPAATRVCRSHKDGHASGIRRDIKLLEFTVDGEHVLRSSEEASGKGQRPFAFSKKLLR